MNAWHESVTYAARDRMNRYQMEAARARMVKGAAPSRRGVARWREGAASLLHRLADAVAPQPETGATGRVPHRLGAGGRPLG